MGGCPSAVMRFHFKSLRNYVNVVKEKQSDQCLEFHPALSGVVNCEHAGGGSDVFWASLRESPQSVCRSARNRRTNLQTAETPNTAFLRRDPLQSSADIHILRFPDVLEVRKERQARAEPRFSVAVAGVTGTH